MNIQQLIQHKLATPTFGSYRAIAQRVTALGHQVPKESSIEHWGAGYPIKRLPANEAIVGLADAFSMPPTEVRSAFLASMGVLTERPGSLLVSLLPDGVKHLDNRPDLLETVLEVASMAIARAIREETSPTAAQPKTTPKKPPAKAAKKTTTPRRATAPTTRRTRANG